MPLRRVGEKKMQAPLLGLAKSIYYFTIIALSFVKLSTQK